MEITPNPAPGASTSTQVESDRDRLSDTFDSFLTILTTQLQNQDPLEPLSSNEFTQQLVMFSQVEQTLNTNERLDDMLSLLGNNGLTNSISYLGKSVEIGGAKAALENGAAKWTYTLGASAQN
ncbi:MAG: flagellar hook capping FlgD N-terminal domain-containing protein, partial [Alphaproteobacteria bacterium]